MGWERAGVSGGTPAFFCLLSQSTSSPSGAACLRCQSNTAKPLCFSLKLPGLGFSLSRNILRIIALYSNSWFFAISSGIGLRPFAAGVGLGERTRPRVRRLTPRFVSLLRSQPKRPRCPAASPLASLSPQRGEGLRVRGGHIQSRLPAVSSCIRPIRGPG